MRFKKTLATLVTASFAAMPMKTDAATNYVWMDNSTDFQRILDDAEDGDYLILQPREIGHFRGEYNISKDLTISDGGFGGGVIVGNNANVNFTGVQFHAYSDTGILLTMKSNSNVKAHLCDFTGNAENKGKGIFQNSSGGLIAYENNFMGADITFKNLEGRNIIALNNFYTGDNAIILDTLEHTNKLDNSSLYILNNTIHRKLGGGGITISNLVNVDTNLIANNNITSCKYGIRNPDNLINGRYENNVFDKNENNFYTDIVVRGPERREPEEDKNFYFDPLYLEEGSGLLHPNSPARNKGLTNEYTTWFEEETYTGDEGIEKAPKLSYIPNENGLSVFVTNLFQDKTHKLMGKTNLNEGQWYEVAIFEPWWGGTWQVDINKTNKNEFYKIVAQ